MISKNTKIFMLGIGGIGMNALAKWFLQNGMTIHGYDKVRTDLTIELENMGVPISYIDDPNSIAEEWQKPASDKLVVYTVAVPKTSHLFSHFVHEQFKMTKRAEILGLLSNNKESIAVAGTHGKTTVSALTTHILKTGDIDCNAFIGGVTRNFNSSVVFGKSDLYVVEADEFDRSFLQLTPKHIIVTAMDADHLDIYKSKEEMLNTYHQFVKQKRSDGVLICKYSLDLPDAITCAIENPKADAYISNIHMTATHSSFDYRFKEYNIPNIHLSMSGIHNIENACMVITLAINLGIDIEKIKQGLNSFLGIKRRFDFIINNDKHVYIDDYAHHPQELSALIRSVRKIYPNKELTLIFQPHLYSRTKDFGDEFAEVLDLADKVILLEIYPAREEPIEGINAQFLLDKMKNKNACLLTKPMLYDYIKQELPPLTVSAGAGNIDECVEIIKGILNE